MLSNHYIIDIALPTEPCQYLYMSMSDFYIDFLNERCATDSNSEPDGKCEPAPAVALMNEQKTTKEWNNKCCRRKDPAFDGGKK